MNRQIINRTWMTILMLVVPHLLFAQLDESFSDGNFTKDPVWVGDTAKFSVQSGWLVSGSSIVSDRFFLSTPLTVKAPFRWNVTQKLLFNTSSLNYTDIFLCSDSSVLTGNNSGYFVRSGGTEDEVSLYYKNGPSVTRVIDGRNGLTGRSFNQVHILVELDTSGTFRLWTDTSLNADQPYEEGACSGMPVSDSLHFGWVIRQSTQGFFKRHYLGRIEAGTILRDTLKPCLTNVEFKGPDTLYLKFTEKVRLNRILPVSFPLLPVSVRYHRYTGRDSSELMILFSSSIPEQQTVRVMIHGISDASGNRIQDTMVSLYWYRVWKPDRYDLLITELLPDPEPVRDLPPAEFIEVFNAGNRYLDLGKCSLGDASSRTALPPFILPPDSFLILCRSGNEPLFGSYKVIGLPGFPSLNNDGDAISLRNPEGTLIYGMTYDLSDYGDPFKQNGGWSLELRDTTHPCAHGNFRASSNLAGGTPGRYADRYEVLEDHQPPFVRFVLQPDSLTLGIRLNEAPDSLTVIQPGNISLAPTPVEKAWCDGEFIFLRLERPFERGLVYTLSVIGLRDCFGLEMKDTQFVLTKPVTELAGALRINEILFDPFPGSVDFVELVNGGMGIFSLREISIANEFENVVIDTNGLLLFPGEVLAFTTEVEPVIGFYRTSDPMRILQIPELPSMPDDAGIVRLRTRDGQVVDELRYEEEWHFPLLTDREGVSLERMVHDPAVSVRQQFASASATSGYATPGRMNSRIMNPVKGDAGVTVYPDYISPNQDGMDDMAAITVNLDGSYRQVTAAVFDREGHLVRWLANNVPSGNAQTWYWDGLNGLGKPVMTGIYLVYIEIFGTDGKRSIVKRTITVGQSEF